MEDTILRTAQSDPVSDSPDRDALIRKIQTLQEELRRMLLYFIFKDQVAMERIDSVKLENVRLSDENTTLNSYLSNLIAKSNSSI